MRPVIGIESLNSIDFVRRMIACHDEGNGAAAWRSKDDRERLEHFHAREFISPAREFGWARLSFTPRDGDDLAQIAFTSGTTGRQKAIALTNSNIANTLSRLTEAMAIDADIREYVGVPVTYSFGLARARAIAAAGGAFFLPEHGFSPAEAARMLKSGEINSISAVPSLWRLALNNADLFGPERARLRWIETGSQFMSRQEKEALKSLFPNAIIVQHYGLTEASRTTFLPIHELDGEALESVGFAADPVEVRLDGDGRIMIRGPHVARFEIIEDGEKPLVDAEGWLTTSDSGEMRSGMLFYKGRLDDLINCAGVKIDPESLERDIRLSLGAPDAELAVTRIDDAMRGDGVLVAIGEACGVASAAVSAAAADALAKRGISAGSAIRTIRLDSLPKTETGKFKRREIAAIAASASPAETGHGDSIEDRLIALWTMAFDGKAISRSDSYFDLGGAPGDDPAEVRKLVADMIDIGVPPAVAHGVIDGLTIAQIAQETEAFNAERSLSAIEEKILGVWRSALGRDDVSVESSFYDIGGDSLSAVTVALSLEKAGLDPQIAQGVFNGRTIRDLAREFGDTTAAKPEAARTKPQKTELAVFNEASNFMKGAVLLCMISSHWFPPFQERYDIYYGPFGRGLALLYSLGSPTLAFMFGLGIAVFQTRQHRQSRKSFERNYRLAVALLAAGVILNGLTELSDALVSRKSLTPSETLSLFYGPFVYFFIATSSLPLWIGAIHNNFRSAAGLVAAGAAAYGAYAFCVVSMPAPQHGAATLLQEILTGRWSILQMGAISFFGAAFGVLVQRTISRGGNLRAFAPYGLMMMTAGIAISVLNGNHDDWFRFPKQITFMSTLFYSGVAVVVIAYYRQLIDRATRFRPAHQAINIIACLGILLFPLFVLQSFVYRGASMVSRVLESDFLIILSILILVFTMCAAALTRKVYNIYYPAKSLQRTARPFP